MIFNKSHTHKSLIIYKILKNSNKTQSGFYVDIGPTTLFKFLKLIHLKNRMAWD